MRKIRWIRIQESKNFWILEHWQEGEAVLRIRISVIHMLLGLLDPDLLVIGTDPDPDHQAKIVR